MIGDRVTRSDNPDGSPNFQTATGFLHSRRNPREEAERFARVVLAAAREHPGARIVVVGIGWGYVIEALHALDPDASFSIFFLEPLDDVCGELAASGREKILESLSPGRFLGGRFTPGPALLQISPAYERLYGDEIRAFAAGEPAASVDQSTRQAFFSRWVRHHIRFLCAPGSARMVPPLFGKQGPVLFCGAAPSLLDDLEGRLADLRAGRAFVICADTAFAPLLALGIRPDLVISVDAGRGTAFHFAAAFALGGTVHTIPVLTWSGALPAIALYTDRLLYFRTSFPFDQLLGSGPLAGVPEWINRSRNTAGIALFAAKALGRRRLFHAGVSFRSEKGLTHTKGTGYTLFALLLQSRTHTLEMYQPKGYASDLTEKNRIASEGIAKMASDLLLDFCPAGDSPAWIEETAAGARAVGSAATESTAAFHGSRPEAVPLVVDRGELRSFVRRVREGIDFEAIRRETGTPSIGVEKWKRLFQKV